MNNKFDELAKGMAQSVTRRAALKKFGVGLAGMALACFGLENQVHAGSCTNRCRRQCQEQFPTDPQQFQTCYRICLSRHCFV